MPAPKFVQRIARLPEVLNVLAAYPEGLSLRRLASQFGVDEEAMRQDLVTYLELESWGWSHDIFRRPAVEFVQSESGYTSEGAGGTVVRIVEGAEPGLGVEHLSAGDLALVYTAGMALLDIDDGDTDLVEALDVIAETMYGEPTAQARSGSWNRHLGILQQAQLERRRVKIVYSNSWRPGVSERVIEPLRLVQTHRGWEVDAGPVGPEGNLRTYLLSNVRSAEFVDGTFEPPTGLVHRLDRQRRTTTVRMELTQDSRWAADMYAERVTVLEEDEATFIADLDLLPPAGDRVGLIILASGSGTRVLSPSGMVADAMGVVEELLRHHAAGDEEPSDGSIT